MRTRARPGRSCARRRSPRRATWTAPRPRCARWCKSSRATRPGTSRSDSWGSGGAGLAEPGAAVDHGRAEALLREGLERLPGDRSLRAALARRLARADRVAEAIALAESCVAEAPEDVDGLGALRDSYAAGARWNDALRVAAS